MVDDREEPSVEIGPAVISLKFAVSYYKNKYRSSLVI